MKIRIYHHSRNHLIEQFVSFTAALWSANLVSVLFEQKNQKNLWGLTGEKMVLSSNTYSTLESIVSVTIGFIVLLLANSFFEKNMHLNILQFMKKYYRWARIKIKSMIAQPN